MKVNWDDEIPNIWENKKCSKPPTRHIREYLLCKHSCSFLPKKNNRVSAINVWTFCLSRHQGQPKAFGSLWIQTITLFFWYWIIGLFVGLFDYFPWMNITLDYFVVHHFRNPPKLAKVDLSENRLSQKPDCFYHHFLCIQRFSKAYHNFISVVSYK